MEIIGKRKVGLNTCAECKIAKHERLISLADITVLWGGEPRRRQYYSYNICKDCVLEALKMLED